MLNSSDIIYNIDIKKINCIVVLLQTLRGTLSIIELGLCSRLHEYPNFPGTH